MPEITRDELLITNDDWIRSIEQGPTPLPDQANVIWEKSNEEISMGLTRPYLTKDQMDAR